MLCPPMLTKSPRLFPSFLLNDKGKTLGREEKGARTLGVWAGDIDPQAGCGFLMKLPAEIRNAVYEYVFGLGGIRRGRMKETASDLSLHHDPLPYFKRDRNTPSPRIPQSIQNPGSNEGETKTEPAHPLALLLTCRLISDEASLLAFRLHSFSTTSCPSIHTLHRRSNTLPVPLLSAITSLSISVTQSYASATYAQSISDFISFALLFSPTITEVSVRIRIKANRSTPPRRSSIALFLADRRDEGDVRTCETHVPLWFRCALDTALVGRSYVWQEGEKWVLTFPYLHVQSDSESFAQSYAVSEGKVCDGMCTALFTQPSTHRAVKVRLLYEWDGDALAERRRLGLDVELVPGTEEVLALDVADRGRGMGWSPDEEYWEGLRRRRKDWGRKNGILSGRDGSGGFGGAGSVWTKGIEWVMGGR